MGWGERESKINGLGELSFRRRDPVTPRTENVEDEAVPDWPSERGRSPPTEAGRRRDGGRQARCLGKKAGCVFESLGKDSPGRLWGLVGIRVCPSEGKRC